VFIVKSHDFAIEHELSLKTQPTLTMPRQVVQGGESQVSPQQDPEVEEMEEEPVEQEGEGYGQ
jgi:hypothetical protein